MHKRAGSSESPEHDPLKPKPAGKLSRKDWHSGANGAVLSPFRSARSNPGTFLLMPCLYGDCKRMEVDMGFGRGVLFWLLGIPIPIIILLALFWHH
jgi:hypothetical protein